MKPVNPPLSQSEGLRPSSAPRRSLLYVEDDPANRDVAQLRLQKGFDMVFAADDREACHLLREFGPTLHAVLMDIELQGSLLNGMELTQLIRGRLNTPRLPSYAADMPRIDVPVIFVTAYHDRYPRAELLLSGGDDVIYKPVDFVALHTAITRVILNRLG
jgi:CheY-like chemotaxis protein